MSEILKCLGCFAFGGYVALVLLGLWLYSIFGDL